MGGQAQRAGLARQQLVPAAARMGCSKAPGSPQNSRSRLNPHLVADVGEDALRGSKAQRALLHRGHGHGGLEAGVALAAQRHGRLRQRALSRTRQHAHAAQLCRLDEEGGGAGAGGVLAQRRGRLKHVVGQLGQLVLPLKAAGRGGGARGRNQVNQRRVGCGAGDGGWEG